MSDHPTQGTESGEEIEVGFFRPEDANGIVELFKSVYGDGYPIRLFYDAGAITEANETGTYHSIVARTFSGKVVGVEHLYRSSPYAGLYEVGAGLVLKECRKLGLNRRMLHYLYEEWVPQRPEIEEIWGEAVCNHVSMQKTVDEFDHVETALEVALMPAEAYSKEKSATGRVAALPAFRCYKSKPLSVYLPRVYEQALKFLYAAIHDNRDIRLSDRELPAAVQTQSHMTVFSFARVCRMAISDIGGDFAVHVGELESRARDQNVAIFQIQLDLGSPCVGAAVDILRTGGYFLGGLLPRWFDHDGFLMQKITIDPGFEGIQLYSDRAKQIFAMVYEDWQRTQER